RPAAECKEVAELLEALALHHCRLNGLSNIERTAAAQAALWLVRKLSIVVWAGPAALPRGQLSFASLVVRACHGASTAKRGSTHQKAGAHIRQFSGPTRASNLRERR